MPARTLPRRSVTGSGAIKKSNTTSRSSSRNASPPLSPSDSDASEGARPAKRRKTAVTTKKNAIKTFDSLFSQRCENEKPSSKCTFPGRVHPTSYHRPLLLSHENAQDRRHDLLKWFDTVNEKRGMPWRKSYLGPLPTSPDSATRKAYEKRAYEVWISEIMLQQTRVAVVIDYWNKWMNKWPTIQDLATASADDVLAAWKGLGYYSRATRIHEAAKKVVADKEMDGLLPQNAKDLEAKIPGVGRYTAGAICSIVFGVPEPMVDGNVLRVLSRQLGVLGDVKTTKSVIDLLWAAADALVKAVAKDCQVGEEEREGDQIANDGPGRWGQALMELGSTVCTPKPNCGDCPISKTCKAFQEGSELAETPEPKASSNDVEDIEDLCTLCEPFENVADPDKPSEKTKSAAKTPKKGALAGQSKLTAFAFTKPKDKNTPTQPSTESKKSKASVEAIIEHAKLFPVKAVKKEVRKEETVVCLIRLSNGTVLIEQRPDKGLLASLWEFPSKTLSETEAKTLTSRKRVAQEWCETVVSRYGISLKDDVEYEGELGNVPWLFSHIKLTMHVHCFSVKMPDDATTDDSRFDGVQERRRWSSNVENESMGTGMRKCWDFINDGSAA